MEGVIQALARARSSAGAPAAPGAADVRPEIAHEPSDSIRLSAGAASTATVALSERALKGKHVVAFDPQHKLTRNFDLLRNRILADLGNVDSPVIGVSAPTAGCGVSMTAANLAFSIARQRDNEVLLADTNRNSMLDDLFGLEPNQDASEEMAGLRRVNAAGTTLLTARIAQMISSDSGSRAFIAGAGAFLSGAVQGIRPSATVLDLPPLLQSDDAAALCAHADAVVIVLAVGTSTVADYEASRSSISGSRCYVILNKARPHGM